MTLAHYIKGQEPPRPSFEPVTMPSVFDAMVELYPSPKTMEQYDRTTRRLLFGGCALALALLAVLGAVAAGWLPMKP